MKIGKRTVVTNEGCSLVVVITLTKNEAYLLEKEICNSVLDLNKTSVLREIYDKL